MVAEPLLRTKLYPPGLRAGVVLRQRLIDRLSVGVRSKLTLISAPPGFGKSTLVGAWINTGSLGQIAWLSLDADDNDSTTFWAYVVAALDRVAPNIGAAARTAVDSQPELTPRALLNDVLALTEDVVLVLDDYHVIDRPEVHEGVAFVLDHLPPLVHLVIVTRADPPLPLSRLRARGELVEIRAEDLRFTADETAAYLGGTMRLDLTRGDVTALEARTEGWIAALQLAALSMQGRGDISSFIASFTGDDRYVVDYLADEVLERQSDAVRDFLLHTAVLDRLSASLCDAVTGRDDSRSMLEALERANLFLVAMDDRREWYRYHQLFADVLRTRLLDEHPAVIPGLHRRASDWFAKTGDRSQAIRHALLAGQPGRAADLMELAVPDMRRSRQETSWLRWADGLPTELLGARPVLSVAFAGVLMSAGHLDRVDALLDAAEQWLAMPAAERATEGMVVLDAAEFERLPSAVAMYRAAQARAREDIAGTMDQARRALELAGPDDDVGRGAAAAFLGLAYWTTGDLGAAYRWYSEGMASLERAGHLADVVAGAVTQADIRLGQGRMTDAMSVLSRGLALATAGSRVLRGAADMHVGISDVLRQRNELEAANVQLNAALDAGDGSSYRQFPYRSRVALALIRDAEGDPSAALRLLDEAEAAYVGEFSPDVRPIAALKARIWIARGELPRAWAWARERALSATDALSYLREFEHSTLARLLLAQGSRDRSDEGVREAIELSERLVVFADEGGRSGSSLDTLVVLALSRHRAGDARAALASLDRAIALAEPHGYVRVFLDEGRPMASLLKAAAKRPNASPYVHRLSGATVGKPAEAALPDGLIEPLSERELDVIRLLATDLDGPEIARELVVSLSTVRTHTKNIYAKLGVNNRRSAVRRAHALELLPAPHP